MPDELLFEIPLQGESVPHSPPPEPVGSFISPWSPAHDQAEFNQYLVDVAYFTDEGMCVVRTGAPASSNVRHEAVRTGKAITKKVVTITVERLHAKPTMPHWDTSNPKEILVSRKFVIANPLVNQFGQMVFRASAEYVYTLLEPILETSYLPIPTSGAETRGAETLYFNAGDLSKTIIRSAITNP